jgi:hypothetical protein
VCPLNYIAEINAFYNWAMLNPIPADAQALWHVLMQINNRTAIKIDNEWFWKVEFAIPNSTLTSVLAFSRQQLDRMRNVLIQRGRIVYTKGKGNSAGKYRLIPFDAKYVTQTVTQSVSQTETQTVTQIWAQTGRLCNIIGTYINSNSKYNNSLSGGDNLLSFSLRTREGREDENGSGCGPPSLDEALGMTPEIKRDVTAFVGAMFAKYFGQKASAADIDYAFWYLRGTVDGPDAQGRYKLSLSESRKKLLEFAFAAAQMAGKKSLSYVDGVLKNMNIRGIETEEDFIRYEMERVVT